LELKGRYDKIFVGSNSPKEIDFVAMIDDEVHYYQVALSVRDEQTRERELSAFPNDHYPKFLLTLDPEEGTVDGIKQLNALNWLLNGDK